MIILAALILGIALFLSACVLASALRTASSRLAKALRAAGKPRRSPSSISHLLSPLAPVPFTTGHVVDAAKHPVRCPVCAAGHLLATEVGPAAAVHCPACRRTTGFRASLQGAIALGLAGKLEETK